MIDEKSHIKNYKRTVNFGLMCPETMLKSWQADCLKNLLALDDVHLTLVITTEEEIHSDISNTGEKTDKSQPDSFLYRTCKEYFVKNKIDDLINLEEFAGSVMQLKCNLIKTENGQRHFQKKDIDAIKIHGLDFILNFGPDIIKGDILTVPEYGVWTYCFGDYRKYSGEKPCFWEIYNDDPVTGVVLKKLNPGLDEETVLKKAFFKTNNRSYAKTIKEVHKGSKILAAQAVIDIQNNNADYLFQKQSISNVPLYKTPSNLQMLSFIGKLIVNNLRTINSLLYTNQWNIGIVNSKIENFLDEDMESEIKWLPLKGKSNFIADPFGIQNHGKLYIFLEELDYESNLGKLAYVEYNADSIDPVNFDLGISCHQSYPHLFTHRDDIYMIPESRNNKDISLYRAKDFPHTWEKVTTILSDVSAVDSTVFEYDGRWWLTYTDQEFGLHNNLYVYHSDSLSGEWIPHTMNPVKIDIRSSRPGGTPFVYKNELYRPAQDCSEIYGGKITINKVTKLTPTEFEENVVKTIQPGEKSIYSAGRHTLSSVGEITLIDGHRTIFVKSVAMKKIKNMMKLI